MKPKQNFESWLKEQFIGENVYGEIPITKDNCEDLFSSFLEDQDTNDMMEWADMYGRETYLRGAESILKHE